MVPSEISAYKSHESLFINKLYSVNMLKFCVANSLIYLCSPQANLLFRLFLYFVFFFFASFDYFVSYSLRFFSFNILIRHTLLFHNTLHTKGNALKTEHTWKPVLQHQFLTMKVTCKLRLMFHLSQWVLTLV